MNAKQSKMKCVSASGDSIQMSKTGSMLYTLHDTIGKGGEFKMKKFMNVKAKVVMG